MKSLGEAVVILLTKACLNSGLKRDEANSFYEDNKPAGHQGQTHTNTLTHTEYIYLNTHRHIRRFLLEFSPSSENQKCNNTVYHTSQCNCAASSLPHSSPVKIYGSGDFIV